MHLAGKKGLAAHHNGATFERVLLKCPQRALDYGLPEIGTVDANLTVSIIYWSL